ncbi:unnamed protein product [Polarella glacialis]|uniref:VWFA domain-containing protein n=1 Tax=Polarella glacialis TaxID=89957 RepID=A0A813K4S8_POLGL|nr:unnamed protein product [Polarella glacialis]
MAAEYSNKPQTAFVVQAAAVHIIQPSQQPATTSDDQNMAKLEGVLRQFEISIAAASDLAILQDYEIVIIADDSGSMSSSAVPPGQRVLGKKGPTRWDELKQTLLLMVQLGSCFDASGVDIWFMNRARIQNVASDEDPRLLQGPGPAPKRHDAARADPGEDCLGGEQ